jgi:hypothetical protein
MAAEVLVCPSHHDRNREDEIVPIGVWTPPYRPRRGVVWELDSARRSYQALSLRKGGPVRIGLLAEVGGHWWIAVRRGHPYCARVIRYGIHSRILLST